MKRFLCALGALVCTGQAWAGFALGDLRFNPVLETTGLVGDGGPYFSTITPAWIAPQNLLVSLSSPIEGVPGFAQFRGFVDSFAYRISDETVGLVYRIRLASNSADRLVRAAVSPDGWSGLSVFDAGADGSGTSTVQPGAVSWTDGRPYFMSRDDIGGHPTWNYRFGANGTTINRNQQSGLTWFETDALPGQVGPNGRITLQDGGALGGALIITVPEPTTVVGLIGTGVGLFAFGQSRRR